MSFNFSTELKENEHCHVLRSYQAIRFELDSSRTHLKNSLTPEWLCYRTAQKPHILPCMLRFFAALRLALGRDPYF